MVARATLLKLLTAPVVSCTTTVIVRAAVLGELLELLKRMASMAFW